MSVDSKTKVTIGLGTTTFPVLDTGAKTILGKITLPTLPTGSPTSSQLIVTININGGATIYTGIVGPDGFQSGGYATAGDVFNVILSSSLPLDQGLQTIKSVISFY